MTSEHIALFIIVMSLTTYFTRLFPFLVFDLIRSTPSGIVLFLGKYLPPTIISAIIVYCFKDIELTTAPFAFNEIIAVTACVILHLWRKNTMISIFLSTGIYMLLKQLS